MLKTDNIIILGGGSAGWMTAATMCRIFPEKNITVIESPNTPIIGVGESTLGQINRWLSLLGIKDEEFIPYTNASYKLSIKFTDFYNKKYSGRKLLWNNSYIYGDVVCNCFDKKYILTCNLDQINTLLKFNYNESYNQADFSNINTDIFEKEKILVRENNKLVLNKKFKNKKVKINLKVKPKKQKKMIKK